jgi:hypothetical protein
MSRHVRGSYCITAKCDVAATILWQPQKIAAFAELQQLKLAILEGDRNK